MLIFRCFPVQTVNLIFYGVLQAGGGVHPRSITSSVAMSKPSGGIRSLHSLSACGLPTPIVALACIGNVDIQVFSYADGEPYFLRRFASLHIASPERGGEPPLGGGGVSPCIIRYSSQPVSQRVTLLFFFTEKKKRSKKRKELAFHLYYTAMHHTKITQETVPHRFSSTKLPRRGEQAAAAAVTLPFSQLKLGRRVSGDPPLAAKNGDATKL